MSDNNFMRYVIGASRTKFVVLDELFKKQFPNGIPNYKMAVILVDAHSIMTPIYRPNNEYSLDESSEDLATDVVINFMNVLGHYRRYLATRLHLDNDIFVSYNRIQPKFQKMCFPKYFENQAYRYSDDNYKHKFANKITSRAWTFICELSKYFEGIYCWDVP
ncbi:MAG: hypothetical protein K2F99_03505 [Muribaculaceae bacterium]|nr:hypothetical protein [Muribaculaceae bacterium]